MFVRSFIEPFPSFHCVFYKTLRFVFPLKLNSETPGFCDSAPRNPTQHRFEWLPSRNPQIYNMVAVLCKASLLTRLAVSPLPPLLRFTRIPSLTYKASLHNRVAASPPLPPIQFTWIPSRLISSFVHHVLIMIGSWQERYLAMVGCSSTATCIRWTTA